MNTPKRSKKTGIDDYRYGFSMPETSVRKTGVGLNAGVVKEISSIKKEQKWMRDFRLRAYETFKKKALPTWGAGAGESVADGEAAISSWLRHRDRLVTATDFADLTRRTPGVDLGREEVLPLFHPEADPTQRVPGVVDFRQ